jgi:hypothetical protein
MNEVENWNQTFYSIHKKMRLYPRQGGMNSFVSQGRFLDGRFLLYVAPLRMGKPLSTQKSG